MSTEITIMISYAQNFEDVTLWRALKGISGGRYVDVGAFHPEIDSVTKWFYDQGWSGMNLEPVPEMFAVLEAARPRDTNIRAAAGAVAGVATMAVVPDSMGLSSLEVKEVEASVALPVRLEQVEVRPLREVLELYSGEDIHFLKIDAEGSEHDVLAGMDFVRFRPWVVVVEATTPLSQTKTSEQWEGTLLGANYRHAYFDGLNEFYVASEKADLAKMLAVPPNVFDEFELAATVRERLAREELQRSSGELQRSRDELSAGNEWLRAEVSRRDTELVALQEESRKATAELAASNEEATRLSLDLAASREETARLNQQLLASETALASEREAVEVLRRKSNQADQHIAALREQLNDSNAAIARLSGELSEIAQALRHGRESQIACQLQLQQVLNSRSFRWLAPARRLRELLLPHRQ